MQKRVFVLVLVVLAPVFLAGTALALPAYLATFKTTYPAATAIANCGLCHLNPAGGGPTNPYGTAFAAAGHLFPPIEPLDSDGDGWTNIREIQLLSFPGDRASVPALFSACTATGCTDWLLESGDFDWVRPNGQPGVIGSDPAFNNITASNDMNLPELAQFSSGRLQADIKLTAITGVPTQKPNGSILFAYQDPTNYRYVKVTPTKIVIGQKGVLGGDVAGVKAVVPVSIPLKTWEQLTVDIYATGGVHVYLGTGATTPIAGFHFGQAVADRAGVWAKRTKTKFRNFKAWNSSVLPAEPPLP